MPSLVSSELKDVCAKSLEDCEVGCGGTGEGNPSVGISPANAAVEKANIRNVVANKSFMEASP